MAVCRMRDGPLILLVAVQIFVMVGLSGATAPQDTCSFYYLTHPPPMVPCNPFVTSLQLECSASAPNPHNIEIVWYLSNITSGETEQLNAMQEGVKIDPAQLGVTRRSRLTLTRYEIVGKYWCQIVHPTVGNLSRSIVTTVKPPESYQNLPACPHNTHYHYSQLTCAEPSISVSPIPSPSTVSPPEETQLPQATTALPHDAVGCSATVVSNSDSNQNNGTVSNDEDDLLLVGVMVTAVGVPLLITMVILVIVLLVVAKGRRQKEGYEVPPDEQGVLVSMATNQSSQSNEVNRRRQNRSQSLPPRPQLLVRQPSTDSAYEDMVLSPNHHAQSLIRRLQVACRSSPKPIPPPKPRKQTTEQEDSGMVEPCAGASTEDVPSLEYAEPDARPSGNEPRGTAHTQSETVYINSTEEDQPLPHYQGLDPTTQEYMDVYLMPGASPREERIVGHNSYQLPCSSSMEPLNVYTVPASEEDNLYY